MNDRGITRIAVAKRVRAADSIADDEHRWLSAGMARPGFCRRKANMKNWKKWALLLAISGPIVTTYSCGSVAALSVRDAAIDGLSGFVEGATSDLLDRWFGPDQQAP